MAKARKDTSDDSPRGGVSGARGGPPLARGVIYQINYGLMHALYLIAQALGDPITPMTIHVEPRLISDPELTQWDLRIDPPDVSIEAKIKPSKKDILNFLAVASRAHIPGSSREYRLAYGEEPPLLSALKKLMRHANSAAGDKDAFTFLEEFERLPKDGTDEILVVVGDNAHSALREVTLEHITEYQLVRDIRRASEAVAGPVGGRKLRRILFYSILAAMPDRTTLDIRELIQEARGEGISLIAPVITSSPGLPEQAHDTICVLQVCPDPLPIAVMAEAVGLPETDLTTLLSPLTTKKLIAIEDDQIHLRQLSAPLSHAGPEEIIARTLTALLDHIKTITDRAAAEAQVQNAIHLARACTQARPKAAAPLFKTTEKLLKSQGDKHQVLDVARLTIDAARRVVNRPDEIVAYEAQALICGESWVRQRVGSLTDALAHGEDSLRLGQQIGDHRNTSFCWKCLGRLLRMMAEEAKDPADKKKWFAQSEEFLCLAIREFATDRGERRDPADEGDCWSLLGRTYMKMGRLTDARRAADEAKSRLTDHASKDYADYLILRGELEQKTGSSEYAHLFFSDALDVPIGCDNNRNEIRARAHFQRGRNWESRREYAAAIADYKKAEAIWTRLGERRPAAEAAWQIVMLTDPPERALQENVASEPFTIRMAVVELRRAELARRSKSSLARRSEVVNAQYWNRLVDEARRKDARETIKW